MGRITAMKHVVQRHLLTLLIVAAITAVCSSLARAEDGDSGALQVPKTNWFIGGGGTGTIPAEAKAVTVKEHLNTKIPLDLQFTDETGKQVRLGDYFNGGKRPVILQLGYYRCPMLCSLTSQGLIDVLNDLKLDAGKDYQVVFVSIDPSETPQLAAEKKKSYLSAYHRASDANAWHLLTGRVDQIDKLAQATGFEYRWIASAGQYSHPACLIVATPDGKISRYLYGVKFDEQTVRLSLVEASDGKIGSTIDSFILTCFQYDGHQGKYALAAIGLMKIGGAITVLLVAAMVIFLMRAERRRKAQSPDQNVSA